MKIKLKNGVFTVTNVKTAKKFKEYLKVFKQNGFWTFNKNAKVWNIYERLWCKKNLKKKTFFSFFYQCISSVFIFINTPMIYFIRLSNVCHTLFNNVTAKRITILITQFKNTSIKSSKQNINMLVQIFCFLFSYHLARSIYRYCV